MICLNRRQINSNRSSISEVYKPIILFNLYPDPDAHKSINEFQKDNFIFKS